MPFYTRGDFQAIRLSLTEQTRVKSLHTRTAATQQTLFLSHSHHDADIVEKVEAVLARQGVSLFIDWKDKGMPKITGPNTARALKSRMWACKKFLLLATNNALASRWVPWELGVADAMNRLNNVLIVPVEDTGSPWKGSEYIGIYPYLRKDPKSGSPYVTFPDKKPPMWLQQWLKTRL